MKTILNQIELLEMYVNTMSNFKSESSKRSQEMYSESFEKAKKIIQDLEKETLSHGFNVRFENALSTLKYWS